MPVLKFTFQETVNVSAQAGDIAYYVPTKSNAQFQVDSSDIIEIGRVTFVSPFQIWCSSTLTPGKYPHAEDYIFIAKDNKVNQSNVLGYYAQVDIKNNSKTEAEMFQISADYFESSK
jgi:hypothetical protein